MTFQEQQLEEAWYIYSPGIRTNEVDNSLALGFLIFIFVLLCAAFIAVFVDSFQADYYDDIPGFFVPILLLFHGLWLLIVLLFRLICWPIKHYLSKLEREYEAQRRAEEAQRREERMKQEAAKRAEDAKRAKEEQLKKEKQLIDEIHKMMHENQG